MLTSLLKYNYHCIVHLKTFPSVYFYICACLSISLCKQNFMHATISLPAQSTCRHLWLLRLAVAASCTVGYSTFLSEHGSGRRTDNSHSILYALLQGIIPFVVRHRYHPCRKGFRGMFDISCRQTRNNPHKASPGEPQRTGFIHNQRCFIFGAVEEDDGWLDAFKLHVGSVLRFANTVQRHYALKVPTNEAVVHRDTYGGYELLETWEFGGDHWEYVPVILLHYSKHQQCLLLEGGPKLEKRRTGILEERERKTER